MSKKARALFTILLTIFCLTGWAQDYPMLHFTQDDGLPGNTIYNVYRDSKGFIWISSNIGICRYNGIKFQIFTTAEGIPDNEIFFFREDNFGRLWLATFNGELCFYKDGLFHNAKNTSFLNLPFKTTQIKNINIESDSSVTLIFDNQERFVNIYKNQTSVVQFPKDGDISLFTFLKKNSKGNYEFLHRDSLFEYSANQRLEKATRINPQDGSSDTIEHVWTFIIDQNQKFVVNGRRIFDLQMKLVGAASGSQFAKSTSGLYFDFDGRMMRTSDSGLYIDGGARILFNQKTTSITQDSISNYWVGTYKDGVYVLSNKFAHSAVFHNSYKGEIWYSYADAGRLFFTNSDNNFYELYKSNLNLIYDYKKYDRKEFNSSQSHGFLVIKDKKAPTYTYFNYYLGSLCRIDNLGVDPVINVSKEILSKNDVVKSIIDLDDQIFIRTIRSIYAVNIPSFLQSANFTEKGTKEATNSDRIFAFAKSEDGHIWFSIRNGVYKLESDKEVLQKQFKDITFKKFEFFNHFLIGHTDVGNRLLVCSEIEGKIKIDTVPQQDCIWDKFYVLDSSHLLITTNSEHRIFSVQNTGGMRTYEISAVESPFVPQRVESVSSDGDNVYFLVNGNVSQFRISDLLERPKAPKLFFKTLGIGKMLYQLSNGGYLKIPYQGSKNIAITFSTISFTGKNVFYEYSFSGDDKEVWQKITGEEIDLADQHYGSFKIKVRARSLSGNYCDPIVFTLEIARPYWAQWWFIALYLAFIASVIIVVVRYRIQWVVQKNKKENDDKIRFLKSEYKAMNALMNPHFIFNTLNNVQGLVNRNDKLAANEYLRIFADLVRQNMHNVSKEMISLQKEIDLVENYLALEKLRFKEFLNYEVNVEDDVDTAIIMVPPLLIQPLVENSIKHGIMHKQSTDSCIQLNVYEKGEDLFIEVKDNGVGLQASKKKANPGHESFGLQNIKNRIEQLSIIMGKRIDFTMEEVQEEDGQWTKVSIIIYAS